MVDWVDNLLVLQIRKTPICAAVPPGTVGTVDRVHSFTILRKRERGAGW